MRTLRFAVATVAGLMLYYYVLIYIGGLLAAVQIPAGYFSFFGRQHAGVAHALLNLVLHSLPTVLLIAGGVLAIHRLWPVGEHGTWLAVLLGMLSCLLLWQLVVQPAVFESMGFPSEGALHELKQLFVFPWWSASSVVAPWFGIGLGAWLISGKKRPRQRGVA